MGEPGKPAGASSSEDASLSKPQPLPISDLPPPLPLPDGELQREGSTVTARVLESTRLISQRLVAGVRALTPKRSRPDKPLAASDSAAERLEAGTVPQAQPQAGAAAAAAAAATPEKAAGSAEKKGKKKRGIIRSNTGMKAAESADPSGSAASAAKAASAAAGAGIMIPGADGKMIRSEDVMTLEEEKDAEEEESEEAQNLWQFIFSCGPLMVQILSGIGAELVEAGACQYLALLMLPLWAGIKKLLGFAAAPEPYEGIAPPPPPSQPPFHVVIQEATWAYAESHPIYYLLLCFGLAFVVGTYFLFLKDIATWMDKRRAAQLRQERAMKRGYASLNDDVEANAPPPPEEDLDAPIVTTADLAIELKKVEDQCEEIEMRLHFLRKSNSEAAHQDKTLLRERQQRRTELRELITGVSAEPTAPDPKAVEAAEAEKAAAEASSPGDKKDAKKSKKAAAAEELPPSREPSALAKCLKGPIFKGIMRTFGGVMAISLYFADLISDIQVLTLLWQTGNYLWSWMSLFLLVAQFFVVYIRVIPYLSSTFGSDSTLYITFLWGGFPTGLLMLDFLMFLEPFGLLAMMPLSEEFKMFMSAYKATRTVSEVACESFPQVCRR